MEHPSLWRSSDTQENFYMIPKTRAALLHKAETGGDILLVQYPGPTTHENPLFAGRFNMAERKPVSEERIDL